MLGLPSIVYLCKKYLNISQPEISLERTWTNLVWLLFPCRVLAGYNWSNNSGGHISSSWKTIPDWLRIIHTWDTWWRRWYDQPSQVHGWSSDLWVLCDLRSWKETFWAVISDHTQPCPLRHHMSADFYTIFWGWKNTHIFFWPLFRTWTWCYNFSSLGNKFIQSWLYTVDVKRISPLSCWVPPTVASSLGIWKIDK